MPNREDEYYSNQRDSLRYCSKHKHYYDAQFGCQFCWLENHVIQESPPLQKCPECSETSLYHNEVANIYECVNIECKKTYTEEELEETRSRIEQSANHRNIKEDLESISTENLTKCPVCLYNTLKWIPELNLYECQYDKCHGRTFSKEELEEIRRIREEPTKGKSWFGNEYWDAKKKRWRKP